MAIFTLGNNKEWPLLYEFQAKVLWSKSNILVLEKAHYEEFWFEKLLILTIFSYKDYRIRNRRTPKLIIFLNSFQGLWPSSGLHRAHLSSISIRYKWGYPYFFAKFSRGYLYSRGYVYSRLLSRKSHKISGLLGTIKKKRETDNAVMFTLN